MLSHEILPKLCPQYPLSAVMLPLMQSSVCVWGGGGESHAL